MHYHWHCTGFSWTWTLVLVGEWRLSLTLSLVCVSRSDGSHSTHLKSVTVSVSNKYCKQEFRNSLTHGKSRLQTYKLHNTYYQPRPRHRHSKFDNTTANQMYQSKHQIPPVIIAPDRNCTIQHKINV